MALSMEEQRILTQIETRLSEDDPRLAQRLARHGAPRRHRVRTVALTAVTVLVAVTVLTAIAAAIAAAVM